MGCLMLHTSEISDDIFGLAEVNFLKQVAHLELHVLNHLADIGNMRAIIFHRHILLDLAHHVARKIEVAEGLGIGAERKNDGGGKLVVGGARAVLSIEDMD